MDVVGQETDEPMNSANESPSSAQKMSLGSVNSQGSDMGSPKSPRRRDLLKGNYVSESRSHKGGSQHVQ